MKKFISGTILISLFLGFIIKAPGFVLGQLSSESIKREVDQLNNGIGDQKDKLKKLQKKQEEYAEAIKKAQAEKSSLSSQLAILDNRLAKAQLDIEIIESKINEMELEMQKTNIEIDTKNKEIAKEKEHVANVFKMMQKKDGVTTLEVLLLNNSLSDFLSQVKYLENINEGISESISNLQKLTRQLERQKEDLTQKNVKLTALKNELTDNRNKVTAEVENKSFVLVQVGNSENEFQRLLAKSKKEQENANAEIASMEKLMRAKLAKLDGKKLEMNPNGLVWPVPRNTITAYFHDPDYPFRNIFEHPAVDIRAGQGTPLKAAASGYVGRAKYGAKGSYGYIMLIHGDGLSTVYGHASRITVQEDDYVTQGQIIGYSGGMPGADGSGGLTTGAHLHFETRLNGIPVDPLGYLR
ncbi:peptidoglycan DD-metalloendopeptidase family protein [Candidatus Parcubacteria bacterium]|nr:peptidoglycan DD-metalloendopeptidase family protein [Patescibacteria group bacterium]MBU4309047.1 peptidoglycan DD-metalloendopeptidase family protein [Patescibacteria group bacterium]MBU4431929.1 peptidoglycan DD-metalloendopeptidase family protein [Patescibacteria group bacterium]MBU4577408.1 peptidoglycan DD-metalloendopeptidase family protein [Patescibacteria group bacterium]MCG2697096.1 peptidoglycan DD-metalloendopeptidase family protein [Candidatus Parcubacteria bacterium]